MLAILTGTAVAEKETHNSGGWLTRLNHWGEEEGRKADTSQPRKSLTHSTQQGRLLVQGKLHLVRGKSWPTGARQVTEEQSWLHGKQMGHWRLQHSPSETTPIGHYHVKNAGPEGTHLFIFFQEKPKKKNTIPSEISWFLWIVCKTIKSLSEDQTWPSGHTAGTSGFTCNQRPLCEVVLTSDWN